MKVFIAAAPSGVSIVTLRAVGVEEVGAVGPEDRHEVGDDRVALAAAEDVAEVAAAAGRGHRAGRLDHVVPGLRPAGQTLLGELGAVIEEHLGVADVGHADERPGVVGVAADGERLAEEVVVRAAARADLVEIGRQVLEMAVLGEERNPRIVHQDDVEDAGLGRAGVGALLEDVGVGRLDDLDLDALHRRHSRRRRRAGRRPRCPTARGW